MITKDLMKKLRVAIDQALVEAGEKHGVKMKVGNGTFTDLSGSFKLNIQPLNEDGQAVSKHETDFLQYCHLYDLEPKDFGTMFNYGTGRFKLVGLKPRAPKYPIVGEDSSGRKFKFPKGVLVQLH